MERMITSRHDLGAWKCHRGFATAFGVVALAASAWAQDSIVLVDTKVYTHKQTIEYVPASPPFRDLAAPFNFSQGTLHWRLEVIQKPSDKMIYWIPVLVPHGGEESKQSYGLGKVPVTKKGVYDWNREAAILSPNAERGFGIDFKDFPSCRMLLHWHDADDKHTESGVPDYYPMTYRFTVVFVAKGAKYRPPGVFAGVDPEKLTHVQSLVPLLREDKLGAALLKADEWASSGDAQRAEQARSLSDALKRHAEETRSRLRELLAQAPDQAVQELSKLAKQYLPSPLGKQLEKEARALLEDPEIARSVRAQAILGTIEEAGEELRKRCQYGTRKPTELHRLPACVPILQKIALGATKLRREYAGTKAADRALKLAAEFGIKLAKEE